jgi:glycosyltransferase involved in cell wall biosynthesis
VTDYSIVIPAFNRPHLLERAVRSALDQNPAPLEVIVVDDGSVPPLADSLPRLRDPRLRFLRRPGNGGNAVARNAGIAAAQGEWITFLDDDDEYLPGFLEACREAHRSLNPAVGFTWSGIEVVRDASNGTCETVRRDLWNPTFATREAAYAGFLVRRRVGTACGLAVRRQVFDTVGLFDEGLRAAVDTEFLIRAVKEFEFAVVPRVLVRIHLHSGAHVRKQHVHRGRAYRRILRKHRLFLRSHPRTAAELAYKVGWLYRHAGDERIAQRYLRLALSLRPLWPKALAARLFLALPGQIGPAVHRLVSRFLKAARGGVR